MAASAIGLKTYIWNNELRSAFLLGIYPVLISLLAMGWSFVAMLVMQQHKARPEIDWPAFLSFTGSYILPAVFAFCGLWFTMAYLFRNRIFKKLVHSRIPNPEELQRLQPLLEVLCISRGLTLPQLRMLDSTGCNAFASGLNRQDYTITVTTGLLSKLDDAELEAVLAHELVHIVNQDVRLMMIFVIFVHGFGVLGNLLGEISFRSRRDSDARGNMLLLILWGFFQSSKLVSWVLQLAISRKREYLADMGAVELTKRPEALIGALTKIHAAPALRELPGDIRRMGIAEDSLAAFSLFNTHPSLEDRVEAIRTYSIG